MAEVLKELATIAQIADRHGVPVHRVSWIVKTRGIEPAFWVGNTRAFDAAGEERIVRELHDQPERADRKSRLHPHRADAPEVA